MKVIQVSMDERLLRELDATPEASREGRSAVMRSAVAEYLERRRRVEVAERYRRAYSDGQGLGDEFAGWTEEGSWPPD